MGIKSIKHVALKLFIVFWCKKLKGLFLNGFEGSVSGYLNAGLHGDS